MSDPWTSNTEEYFEAWSPTPQQGGALVVSHPTDQVNIAIDKAVGIAKDQIADINWDELSDNDATELKSTISDLDKAVEELQELQALQPGWVASNDDDEFDLGDEEMEDETLQIGRVPEWALAIEAQTKVDKKEAKDRGSKAFRNWSEDKEELVDHTHKRPGKDESGKWVDWGIEYDDNPPKDEEYYRVRAEIAEDFADCEYDDEKERESVVEGWTKVHLHGDKVKKARESIEKEHKETQTDIIQPFKIQQWYTVAFWALMIYPMMALYQDWEHGSNTFIWAEHYGQQLFILTWFKVWLMAVIWRIPKWFEMFGGQLDDYYEGRFGIRSIVFIIDLPFIIWMVITVVGWIISLFKDD